MTTFHSPVPKNFKWRSLGVTANDNANFLGFASASTGVATGTNTSSLRAAAGAELGFKSGDRIAVGGVATVTALNGIWTIDRHDADDFKLIGCTGLTGVPVLTTAYYAIVNDTSPFMKGHDATFTIGDPLDNQGTAGAFGPVTLQGCDVADDTWLASEPTFSSALTANPSTNYIDCIQEAFGSALAGSALDLEIGGGALTAPCKLHRFMRAVTGNITNTMMATLQVF